MNAKNVRKNPPNRKIINKKKRLQETTKKKDDTRETLFCGNSKVPKCSTIGKHKQLKPN